MFKKLGLIWNLFFYDLFGYDMVLNYQKHAKKGLISRIKAQEKDILDIEAGTSQTVIKLRKVMPDKTESEILNDLKNFLEADKNILKNMLAEIEELEKKRKLRNSKRKLSTVIDILVAKL